MTTDLSKLGDHISLLAGYTTNFVEGGIQYRYIIYNSYPETEPDSWDIEAAPDGQIQIWPYEQVCKETYNDEIDGKIVEVPKTWGWTFAVKTDYSSNVLEPIE